MTSLKIALIQMVCEKGRISDNMNEIIYYMSEAEQLGIDINPKI